MQVGQVGQVTAQESKSGVFSNQILGKEDFLRLLITELRYQDPLDPMKDRDFIAQMATFSSLEQMYNLNTKVSELSEFLSAHLVSGLTLGQAASWLGKEVVYQGDEGMGEGTVDAVTFEGGFPYLVVGGRKVAITEVLAVREKEARQSMVIDQDDASQLSEVQPEGE